MSGNIFISYRRSDSTKDARALYERLRREFGEQRVFVDLEGIEPGEDFVVALEHQLDGCEVLVVLMGRDWAEAKDEDGRRRLDDENDFVHIELRAALRRGIKVFPVLVDGALPPKAAQLPEDLRPLVRRQAIALDYAKFDGDVARLSNAIRKAMEGSSASASARQFSDGAQATGARLSEVISQPVAASRTGPATGSTTPIHGSVPSELPSSSAAAEVARQESGALSLSRDRPTDRPRESIEDDASVSPSQRPTTEVRTSLTRVEFMVVAGILAVGSLILVFSRQESPPLSSSSTSHASQPDNPTSSRTTGDPVTNRDVQAEYDK